MEAIHTLARFSLVAVSALTLYVIVMLAIFFLRRRGWIPGGRPTYKSLGSAFLHLQNIAQPDTQYVLEETEKKRKEDEGAGGPDDPTAHLKRRREPRGN